VVSEWVNGGDLATTISDGLQVLERAIDADPSTWTRSGT
jgi:hypothetical protein